MTRVKICGITTPEDRDAAITAGAHALGFTVDVPVDTPREITPEQAASLIQDVPPFVTTVLVTMPADATTALDLLDATGADAIQLHGTIPQTELETIHTTGSHATIIAVDPRSHDHDHDPRIAGMADAVIIDSAREHGAGGTGRTTDWDAARRLRDTIGLPVVLAGGLTPDNVRAAVRAVDPHAVDVASGVERAGGRKDHTLVRAFVRNATTPEATPDQ